ncbi:MAG: hypothetical protein OM95_02560 [Bdellovibrio sp. ArHS]|uniref:DUF366 family protein n=1 Tax=Bdellovibrio sp. ArHS TaxID=1569284 RepID=UPI000582657F|nr:DUF366 family protein [Bdellovibrio sp. ArHS]KHD89625.1 MAG: hypothetical protein OM95_02560 [Bdellovibrio sp. ArHS]
MKTLFIERKFPYDGTQLHSLFAYLEHKVLGPSIVSWQGPCSISFEHMVDGEDLLEQAQIKGDEMLHFIIEVFDRDLFSGVALQRMFAAIAKDYLQSNSAVLKNASLVRDGDDIYWEDRKLSISIATKSPVSVMVHFAMNVTNQGTPVKTLSLQDLQMEPRQVAEALMVKFQKEFTSIVTATQKVRPVS